MANLLDKYGNIADEVAVPASESVGKAKQRAWLKKKELRAIKALTKALRQRNKLMKQEAERRKAGEEAAAEKAAKRKSGDDSRGFLGGFAKAICKVLPQIVTAAVTAVLGFFFHRKPSRRALQAAL